MNKTIIVVAAVALATGCGSKDGAPSGSSSSKAGASGSTGPKAVGSGSSGAVASGGKPRVPHEMSGGDVCVHAEGDTGAKLVSADDFMWPNGSTIKVGFLDGKPEWIESVVTEVNEWMEYANIKFEWHKEPGKSTEMDELVTFKDCGGGGPAWFVRAPGPASSRFAHRGEFSVCLSAYPAEMNMGAKDHAIANTKHEFGHVLGLMHEQFNPGMKVTWDREYVYEWCERTQKWPKENCDRQVMDSMVKLQPEHKWRVSPFDKDSIMFYGILDPNFTTERVVYPQPLKISEQDKKGIGEMYPKGAPADSTDPKEAAKGYDLETQIKKLGDEDDHTNYIMAVGVAEASDRTKVAKVSYVFPPAISTDPVEGDVKHEQFVVQGKVAVPKGVKTFKVRAEITMKDGSRAVVDKEFNLESADGGGGDIIKGN